MKLRLLFILLGFSTVFLTKAQNSNHIPGELLVQASRQNIYQVFGGKSNEFEIAGCISQPMRIWKIKFNPQKTDETRLLNSLKLNPLIDEVQFNHRVKLRDTIPNDPKFSFQWQYINDGSGGGTVDADLDMELAWDITTGGVTPLGDTIVVCAVDDGIDTGHVDFEDNLWVNHGEIPNNGIDDDGNGYVDDFKGWNIGTETDYIMGGQHGTSVAGIMGAKGNNGIGVSGVNWNVKVMVVKNDFDTGEAEVIEAYTYPLIMRRLYNQTNGAEGAFVVAVNSSWGIDLGQPSESPLWCAFYDTLGKAGILSCGATVNWDYNVDEQGDLPTACSSPYLISVTNVDDNDEKVFNAGYGKKNIDLGAFGDGAYTTDFGNTYAGFGGTSGATPHVTGTVGLLYSVPCIDFAQISKDDPALAALILKDAILSQTDSNTSLTDITVTGGRLNVYNSVNYLHSACDSGFCLPPFFMRLDSVNNTTAWISWQNLKDTALALEYKKSADTIWTGIYDSAITSFTLTGLEPCQNYSFRIKSKCNSGWSDYSKTLSISTHPLDYSTFETTLVTDSSIEVAWEFGDSTKYQLHFKNETQESWSIHVVSNDTFYAFDGLKACQNYQVKMRGACGATYADFSSEQKIKTDGCDDCTSLSYCSSYGKSGKKVFIDEVVIGSYTNTSGSSNGLEEYLTIGPTLNDSVTYGIVIKPGFEDTLFDSYVKAWIDFNHDGLFTDSTELLISDYVFSATSIGNPFELDFPSYRGVTRARIAIALQDTILDACQIFDHGEVEDYCIEIVNDQYKSIPENLQNALNIYPNPSSGTFYIEFPSVDNSEIQIYNVSGKLVQSLSVRNTNLAEISMSKQHQKGVYFVKVIQPDATYIQRIVFN